MIEIRHLRKMFSGNDKASLNDVSLDIPTGSFFSLFGPSGCGKSTLLRSVAGLETPDYGEIRIDGRTVFDSRNGVNVPANKRGLGMVFQSYAIWPHMTVMQNVSFPLEAQGIAKPAERAEAALHTVGLGAFKDQHASRLSGGQQQRVALARAIVAAPSVLLLDEPLSNLDAALRDQMRAEILELKKKIGVTAIYVTHDHREALSMSDSIAVMRAGEIVEIATPDELFYRPKASFSAKLIGGANLIEGDAIPLNDGGSRVLTSFGELRSDLSASGKVEIFIRPEKIRIVGRDTPAQPNAIACSVQERRFMGDSTELDLVAAAAPDGPLLRSRVATEDVCGLGDEVHAVIDPKDLRTFPSGAHVA